MKRVAALALLLASASMTCGPAAAVDYSLVAMGYGVTSCNEFTQAYRAVPVMQDRYLDWAQGFMTGMNAAMIAAKQPTHDINHETAARQQGDLRDYCTAHPGDSYATAVLKMMVGFPAPPNAQ